MMIQIEQLMTLICFSVILLFTFHLFMHFTHVDLEKVRQGFQILISILKEKLILMTTVSRRKTISVYTEDQWGWGFGRGS